MMDGSDGPPSRHKHVRFPAPQQPRSPGSHPVGRFYHQGEDEPLLERHSDAEVESGLSRYPSIIRRIALCNVFSLPALSAILFMYLGYTLNSTFHEVARQGWALEVAKHQALRLQMNHDEAVWEEMRAKHEEQEKQRHDDEIKGREGISWEGLAAARCSRYATREYTAVLNHVPLGFDAMEECRKKTINIHGRELVPSRCEDQGTCGRVTGHWYVDFEEPGCITWWRWWDDKGCYSSGVRLYHSRLENLEHYDLWPAMCSTTPREVNGVHYDGPTSCADFGQGPWGIWHIPDQSCP